MTIHKYMRFPLCCVVIFLGIIFCAAVLAAQTVPGAVTGVVRGQVTDQSGAAVVKANVIATPATGAPVTVQTDAQGNYEIKGLAPGKYSLNVVADGFATYENESVDVAAQPVKINVQLAIEVEEQKVQVSDTAPTVDVNPANNAGAITLSGKELEALPDDPDELLTDLQALAGPSAGPNGGQLYIDGFTAGQLPPKSSIREIRINQNPFSSEFDKLGYGRIEIFTKPGTDKFHGQILVNGNDSSFNTADPLAGPEPGYDSVQYNGNIGGPINKNSSFFFNIDRRNINDLQAINAQTLDPDTLLPITTAESVPFPHQRTNIGPRLDYALSKNNTLTARYQYWRDTETNNGIGTFVLPSQAYNSTDTEHTVQVSDTQLIGTKVVNETRVQYLHENDTQNPLDLNPAVSVPGFFTGGGNGSVYNDHQDHYELQNYTSVIYGNQTMKFGARLRALRDLSYSTGGFNGTFTFSSLAGDTDTPAGCSTLQSNPPCPISFQYALQQLASGGTPYATQLSYTTGLPNAEVTTFDAGLYFQDDWRIRPNITLSLGLRFESQNYIQDHADWAPRLGFAWGVHGRSGPPLLVIRGGAGIFYDRFSEGNILEAERLNGITQQRFVVNNPTCFPGLDQPLTDFSSCGPPSTSSSTIYQISPRFRSPGTLQAAVSAERQLSKTATLSVTYLHSRGFDQLVTINADAPFPGTPCFPTACPTPSGGAVYRYVSEGVFNQNQLIANTNWRAGTKVQLFGYYTLNYAKSDANGGFPSNSYDIAADYGRASFDTRQRLFFGGSIALPYSFRLSPFMVASSGSPFNITVPNDLNGDTQFNDRPGFISSSSCAATTISGTGNNIYCTPLGTFDSTPTAGERLTAINYGTGPSHFTLNFRLTKTIGFGPSTKAASGKPNANGGGGGGQHGGGGPRGGPLFGTGGGGGMFGGPASDRRYNLTLGANARNVFNKVNFANPSGVLGSPYFDTPNSLLGGPFSTGVANRRIDLFATFNF
jgi:Carboxypeptidase regulatory-like domain/TonB dependent receptor